MTRATLSSMRAARAMFVFTPPGWMQVAETGEPARSSSSRSASVKPRTANLDALYAPCVGTLIRPKVLVLEMLTTCPSPAAAQPLEIVVGDALDRRAEPDAALCTS